MLALTYKKVDRRGIRCRSCGNVIHINQECIRVQIEETPIIHFCGKCMYVFRDSILEEAMLKEGREIFIGGKTYDHVNTGQEGIRSDGLARRSAHD